MTIKLLETHIWFIIQILQLKQPLGMTSISVFSFVMNYCIPQIKILFFSEFLDF